MSIAVPRTTQVTITLPNRRVLVAVGASLAVHAGIAAGLYSYTGRAGGPITLGEQPLRVASDLALAMQGMGVPPEALAAQDTASAKPTPAPPPPPPAPPPPSPAAEELAARPPAAQGPGVRERLEIEVTPGIDDSDAQTPNWLGAAKGTEHSAMKSTTDQPAMSRDPGRRGADDVHDGRPASPTEAGEGSGGKGNGDGGGAGDNAGPSSDAAAQGQDASRETAEAREGRGGRPDGAADGSDDQGAAARDAKDGVEGRGPAVVAAPKPEDTTGLMPEQVVETQPTPPTPKVQAAEEERPAGQSADPRAATDAATLGAPTAAGGGQAPAVQPGSESKVPGKKSDAESPASSREASMKFRPGMPLAHEGLRIRPKLPRYTMTTRATSRPNNPQVVVKFNRAGKVVKAEFVPGRSTGSPEWDGPLLASLYEWTAAGKKLQDLPTDDPDALFVLKLEYLLHD